MKENLFAFDCGATNWRLYRAMYDVEGNTAKLLGEPQPSPLTSFVERKLPALFVLGPDGNSIESFGEVSQERLDDEDTRERICEFFKPSIGAHLEKTPQQQKRYSHTEALKFTSLLLQIVLSQLQQEKWRSNPFDEQVRFAFSYPVHWRYEHDGEIYDDFKKTVLDCFEEDFHKQIRFLTEPEGAILSLQRHGLLSNSSKEGKVSLVVDVGGSTTDLIAGTIIPATGELDSMRRFGGMHGGGLYDDLLAAYIADELNIPSASLKNDPSALISLRISARTLKESLSRQLLRPGNTFHTPRRTVTLVMKGGEIYRRVVKLDEPAYRGICRHLIADFEYLIETGIKSMGLSDDEIDQVVLVGGGAQLYSVIGYLRDRFGESKVVLADNPDEIVVQGTCLEYLKYFSKNKSGFRVESNTILLDQRREDTQIIWQLEGIDGKTFPIKQGITIIGRKSQNDVWLKDNRVSRFHAEIREVEGKFEIVDLGSSNGIEVDENRIASNMPTPLAEGSKLKIGDSVLTFKPMK